MATTFYADKLDWQGAGYTAAPTPAADAARAGDPAGPLWVRVEAVLQRLRGGDFAATAQALELYREAVARRDWGLVDVCVKLLGDAGPGPLMRRLMQELVDAPRGDPKKEFDYCRILAAWGHLSAVPVLLDQIEEHTSSQDFEVLPIYLSWLLEPEWGPVCLAAPRLIRADRVEEYLALVTGVAGAVRGALGGEDAHVFHGQRFGVLPLARLLPARLGFDHYRAEFWPLFRRKFEAATGVPCGGFFDDRSFQPLTAAALVEEFLESPAAARYEDGVRYFFGHRIPDWDDPMPAIIPEIVSQHVEEAAFLWMLRASAVHAPHYRLKDLVRLDDRVEAHLDGLRANGDPAWELVKGADGPGAVFAAAVLAVEDGKDERIAFVLEKGAATPAASRGLISALGWLPWERVAAHVQKLSLSDHLPLKRVGIAAAAAHRQHPSFSLGRALGADPLLQARMFQAVAEFGATDMRIPVSQYLDNAEPRVRFRAAWAGTIVFAKPRALAALQEIAEAGGRFAEDAAGLAARRLPPLQAERWRRDLAEDPARLRAAVAAAGAAGNPEVVPWLIEMMRQPPLARAAGEAFSLLTGVHISYDKLAGRKPEGFEPGPSEKPEDEDVATDPDENLAWPDPGLVESWWQARRGGFTKGTRYLLGKPITPETLRAALATGYQRQRAAAALELALLKSGTPLFETRAPGRRQQEALRTPV